ncbi:HNH endonuclease [Nocardia sp. NPDC050435]|uniref:HNH endonuclease n=1 Tax=Nocardia sp. NPDC050435 TaxID=3155040 RepID=UPI0033C877DE
MALFRKEGRDNFLADRGFTRARDYFVLHDGRAYDSKAIAGVAYGLETGIERRSADFTGGAGVADRLRALGFEVVQTRDWQLEETILACDLLYQNRWLTIPESDSRIAELSRLLRTQWDFAPYLEELRSINSVHHKLEDLRTAHPGHPGKPKRGGQLTFAVASAFDSRPTTMHALAEALRAAGRLSGADQDDSDEIALNGGGSSADFASAAEGKVVRRLVKVRERNPKLRREKIALARRNRGDISCEICGFDFEKSYPGLGDGYVQVHHVVPLHFSGEIESTLDDLVLVCANCHQMLHRGRPDWLTPDQLRDAISLRAGVS